MRTPLSTVGDEVAPFGAARHGGILGTSAMVTPRAFGCGCAALRHVRYRRTAASQLFPGRHLEVVEFLVGTALCQQLLMRAGLNYSPFVEDNNHVRLVDG